jgi:hypothetical protein
VLYSLAVAVLGHLVLDRLIVLDTAERAVYCLAGRPPAIVVTRGARRRPARRSARARAGNLSGRHYLLIAAAPPYRPSHPAGQARDGGQDEGGEQAADLVAGQRDEVIGSGSGSGGGSPFPASRARVAAKVGGGEHREGDVGVPGSVVTDLVVVEPGFVLGGLEALLDRHRAPATRISSGTGVAAGPAQR